MCSKPQDRDRWKVCYRYTYFSVTPCYTSVLFTGSCFIRVHLLNCSALVTSCLCYKYSLDLRSRVIRSSITLVTHSDTSRGFTGNSRDLIKKKQNYLSASDFVFNGTYKIDIINLTNTCYECSVICAYTSINPDIVNHG